MSRTRQDVFDLLIKANPLMSDGTGHTQTYFDFQKAWDTITKYVEHRLGERKNHE